MSSSSSACSATAKRVVRETPFAAPHVLVLAVIDGPDLHAVHRIVRPETTVGRGDDADFVLGDDEVSKRHCLIRWDAGICHAVDPGSLNGTRVNGRDLRPGVAQRLRHLDEIELGRTRMLLLTGRFQEQPA